MLRSLRQGGLVDDEVVIFPKKGVARHSILDLSCYPDDCRCRHLVRASDANAAATLTQKRSRIGVRLGQQDVSGSNVHFARKISSLPSKADIGRRRWDVRFVPLPDVNRHRCSSLGQSNQSLGIERHSQDRPERRCALA